MAALNRTQNLKFDKICRVCLDIKKDMRPLFVELTATMLMEISNVKVAVGDGLPAQLCLQCLHQISRSHAFKELIERNDIKLKQQASRLAEEEWRRKQTEQTDVPVAILDQILDDVDEIIQPQTSAVSTVELDKTNFEEGKVDEVSVVAVSENDALNSDEEEYLQSMFQASSTLLPGRYVCNVCHKEYHHVKLIKQHMRSHSNWIKAKCKKPMTCPVCGRSFKSLANLKIHKKNHERHLQKTNECTACDKCTGKTQCRRKGHCPYVCSICGNGYCTPVELNIHFRRHTGEKPLKCSECSKSFRSHSALSQHKKRHRGIRNHVCSICNKAFYEMAKLKAHTRIHTGERPYECEVCDRRYVHYSALVFHLRSHNGGNDFSCNFCSAKFATSSAKKDHMITHTDHNRFLCDVCQKVCSSQSELLVHLKEHDSEKIFECGECSQRFSSASYLAVHKRSHAEENKYQCSVCEKGYSETTSLKKHMKTHDIKTEDETPDSENSSDSQPIGGDLRRNTKKSSDKHTDGTQVVSVQNLQLQVQGTVPLPERSTARPPDSSPRTLAIRLRFKCLFCSKSYGYRRNYENHMATHKQQTHQQVQQQQEHQQAMLQVLRVQEHPVPLHTLHVQQSIAVPEEQSDEEKFKIAVRNDLFESSNAARDDKNSLDNEIKNIYSEVRRNTSREEDNKDQLKNIKVKNE